MVFILQKQKYAYVGLDTHKATHTAVVIDCWTKKLGEVTFENRPGKFEKFLKDIKAIAGNLTPVFGLEDTGAVGRSLAVFLLGYKYTVKEVNPSFSKSARHDNTIVHKDDSYDAYCIAKVLRDRFDTLKAANPQDIFWTIKQLVSRRDSLSKGLIAIQNQLHGQLMFNYPSYRKFFCEIGGNTALYFWENYPSPSMLNGVTAEKLGEELKEVSHRAVSLKKALQIFDLVAEDGETKQEYQTQRDFIIKSIVKEIRQKKEAINEIDAELEKMIPLTGYKLESMPGIELNTACHIIAEVGDVDRFSNSDKLARFAGTAPVVFSSAGKGKEQRCRQGNRRMNAILYFLAIQQVQLHSVSKKPRNPAFRAYFEKKLSEGKTKPQALTSITKRLVRILYNMMKHKTEYRMSDMAA